MVVRKGGPLARVVSAAERRTARKAARSSECADLPTW
ncbi:MAG: hypothetical protein IPM23_04560 [Candidatus Melainabacteria bacterium]|nr:hypothetical protein [Candidatus Melainabacteria bacterium]